MKNILLRAKHWQLFLVVFVIPAAFYLSVMGIIMSSIINESSNPSDLILYSSIFMILIVFTGLVQFGWFWSVGVGVNKIIPQELKLNVKRFKLAFLFVIISMFGWVFFMWTHISSITLMAQNNFNPAVTGLMLPFMLLLMLSVFYIYYFVAKTLRTAELQREVTVGDYIGEFFLIYFFPIGIWFLQPKINKLVDSEIGADAHMDVL